MVVMEYFGVCYENPAWGKDLTGLLICKANDNSWAVAGSHISSNESWAEHDIKGHFDRREEASNTDTFTWLGKLTEDEIAHRFEWDIA